MNKDNQTEYIKYLESRLKQLSENLNFGDSDLNTLLDVQKEIAVNSFYDFKQAFLENTHLKNQIEQLQKKSAIYDGYIEYLTDSFWWKATRPFRTISRYLKNRRPQTTFNLPDADTAPIKDEVHVLIYANALSDALGPQLKYLFKQSGIDNLSFTILNLDDSSAVNEIAKRHKIPCLNLLNNGNLFLSSKLLGDNSAYLVYVGQNTMIKDPEWLYKMVYPITQDYTTLSILYDSNFSPINDLKTNTPYNKLRSLIFPIGHYECLLLPKNRNEVQFIPPFILDTASALAKRNPSFKSKG